MSNASLNAKQNDDLWQTIGHRIEWHKPYTKIQSVSYHKPVQVEWFADGELNATVSCLDRHLPKHKDRIAYYFVPEDPKKPTQTITYGKLKNEVCKMAHVLSRLGVKTNDRITIYMPMIPEAIYAILACARIGAPHSVIFAGFSPQSIADRMLDCQSDFVITANEGLRGGKYLPLKQNVDQALTISKIDAQVLVVKNSENNTPMTSGRDFWYNDLAQEADIEFAPVLRKSTDPLFLLYTSGSTGKPKGVLHGTGGYLAFASYTHETVFQYKSNQVYWCMADIGWVTGHSYIVYGPLANCATGVLYEGLPTYPDASRLWKIVDDLKVNILYTAPTLIRALMRDGDEYLKSSSRASLEVLGTVGEPINPEAWNWYNEKVGNNQCPVVDTWWQTETGGVLISPIAGKTKTKPGSATFPIVPIEPTLFDDRGQIVEGAGVGHLCLKNSWPGQMQTVYGHHERFEETYFSQFAGYYYTGDECRRDEDGYYWIIGRADDVINVSGHRLGTAEIESAFVSHPSVAETAVVGYPHNLKGQGIYAFVTLKTGVKESNELKKELVQTVRKEIGPLATPDTIQWAPGLPKTRSGKIMRRILKKVAVGDHTSLGDTTTLADPSVVDDLMNRRESPPGL
jgi:acetyl-CoA synthetase